MIENAYQFFVFATIFPFIYIFYFAGLAAFTAYGLILFVNGLKSKWSELNKAGRVRKIISIVFGSIFMAMALFMTIYFIVGVVTLVQRGGVFRSANQAAIVLLNH